MCEIRDQDQETQGDTEGQRWDWIDPRHTVELSEGEVRELREWMEGEISKERGSPARSY